MEYNLKVSKMIKMQPGFESELDFRMIIINLHIKFILGLLVGMRLA